MLLNEKRFAISKVLIPIIIIAVVAVGGAVFFLQTSSTPSSTTTGQVTTSNAPTSTGGGGGSTVRSTEDQWLQAFNSRNVANLASFYASNAVVVWGGNSQGLSGTYTGQGNIRILYGGSIGKTTQLNGTITNYKETSISPTSANVTMSLFLKGNSTVLGNINATIDAVQNWVNNGGQWQIAKENWNYKTFNVQFVVSATTFPQWGALRVGQNPNLVSEKSLEWNAGPFVAAAVYALLASVVVFAVAQYVSRRRSEI